MTDEASYASFLAEAVPGADSAGHTGTADALDRTAARAVISSGEAVALLPNDPWTPFRYRDRWYGMSDGVQDELWRPVEDERQAQLDLMLSRLSLVGRPGSGSA